MRYRSVVYDTARWNAYRHRPGDIIISTPPKCGTTWMQTIVGMLVLGTTTFDRPISQLSPWLDQNIHDLETTVAELETRTHRRFLKTHAPLDTLPWHDTATYIAVARDPRDAAVSWDHHWRNMDLDRFMLRRAEAVGLDDLVEIPPRPVPHEDPVNRFWDWMTRRNTNEFTFGLQFLVLHLRSFWKRRYEPNVVIVHYADLEADLEGEMRRVAKRLGVAVEEARWPELVEAASFESMSARPEALAPNAGVFWRDDRAFFHRGGSGQWLELIGVEHIDRYHGIIRELTDDEEFLSWLHRP